jgi:hypothetical protein
MNWVKKHINILLLLFCFLGYVWLYINFTFYSNQNTIGTVCFFKNITHLPCPSCGITRAIILLMQGNFVASIEMNPLGLIVFCSMIIIPFFVLYDLYKKENYILKLYNSINQLFSQKKIAIPFFTFIIINWIWNMYKHL